MKRYKNLVIGGIQSKIFNVIFVSLILLTVAFVIISAYHSNMLSDLVTESTEKQEKAISETTQTVMDRVVTQSLERSNGMEVKIADEMFDSARDRLIFLEGYVKEVLTHPDNYQKSPYYLPDPKDDGKWIGKIMYGDGVDPSNPEIVSKMGLIAGMESMLIDSCTSYDAANLYIAIPEGAHYTISNTSSTWYENGKLKSYDPRTRGWYKRATTEGKLIFSDGEYDANTGIYCIECAIPVYDDNNKLLAVIGADLYMDELQAAMKEYSIDGEYYLILSKNGHSIRDPEDETFPLPEVDKGRDIRASKNAFLAQIADEALHGQTVRVQLGELEGEIYYVTARPIETTGWVLISAYSHDASGRPAAMLQESLGGIQKESATTYQDKIGSYKKISLGIVSVLLLAILATAIGLGRRIVKPLNAITTNIAKLDAGNRAFKMEDIYRTGDEVEELAQAFADLSHKNIQYTEQLVKVTSEKERMNTELNVASQIQEGMIPHIYPAFPDRPEFDIYATMDPAKEVGGDFYDFFLIDDDHLAMVMADVSGKGIPAALFMMASKILINNVSLSKSSPAEILATVNNQISMNNPAEMFVTVWLGILELSTGKLRAANAGHEYPAIKRANGSYELFKDAHGFVVGGMEGIRYKEYELDLMPGDCIFEYTDGVTEATNAEEELFGTDRMLAALNREAYDSPEKLLAGLRKEIDEFVAGAPQFDDITMLCMKYQGPIS